MILESSEKAQFFGISRPLYDSFDTVAILEIKWIIRQFVALSSLYKMVYNWTRLVRGKYSNRSINSLF
jgi:hypothetical protein